MRKEPTLIYIGPHCYEKTTVLLDVDVLEHLQSQQTETGLSVSEQINNILREATKNE